MKNLFLAIPLLLLISCGRDADPVSAPNKLLDVSGEDYLSATRALENEVREVNFFALPNKDDLENFSFEENDYIYDQNINAWGRVFSNHKIGTPFAKKTFHKYPCFKIEEGKNAGKCLLQEVRNVTSFLPHYAYSCSAMVDHYAQFQNLEYDERIPVSFTNEVIASSTTMSEMINDIKTCFLETRSNHIAGISKNLTALEKEIEFSTFIFHIANVRDKGWRKNVKYLKKENLLKEELENNYFNNFSCYKVRKGTNKGKCYLKKLSRVTSSRAERIRSCEDLAELVPMFEGLQEDTQVPTDTRATYFIAESDLTRLKNDVDQCITKEAGQIKQFQALARDGRTLRDDGKILVRELLARAENVSGKKFMATAATLHDEDTSSGKISEIYIDLENMTISDETKLAVDFQTGKGFLYYSPSLGNMTPFTIKKKYNAVAGYTYYTAHFKFFLDNGMVVETDPVEDKGLSIDTNNEFGFRMGGKMLFHYPDGSTRKGVMKLEVSYKN